MKKLHQFIFYIKRKLLGMPYTPEQVRHIDTIVKNIFAIYNGLVEFNSGSSFRAETNKVLAYNISIAEGNIDIQINYNTVSGKKYLLLVKTNLDFEKLALIIPFAYSIFNTEPNLSYYLEQLN